jgi:hypothetical protein
VAENDEEELIDPAEVLNPEPFNEDEGANVDDSDDISSNEDKEFPENLVRMMLLNTSSQLFKTNSSQQETSNFTHNILHWLLYYLQSNHFWVRAEKYKLICENKLHI